MKKNKQSKFTWRCSNTCAWSTDAMFARLELSSWQMDVMGHNWFVFKVKREGRKEKCSRISTALKARPQCDSLHSLFSFAGRVVQYRCTTRNLSRTLVPLASYAYDVDLAASWTRQWYGRYLLPVLCSLSWDTPCSFASPLGPDSHYSTHLPLILSLDFVHRAPYKYPCFIIC